MDNNEKKSTNRTTGSSSSSRRPVSSQPQRRMSAEEKLQKSMKGLSHMGGGGGGLGLNSDITKEKNTTRKKVGGVVLDMETIQDANKHKLHTKGKRNSVVILVLSLLLVVSLVYLLIAIIGFNNSKKEPNCRFKVEGNATWTIEGKSKTEFILPQGITRDMIFVINAALNINTTESVGLYIDVKALLNGEEILIAGLHEHNTELVRVQNTNRFVYQSAIVGGGTIHLFNGIDFSEAPHDLTSDNLVLEITAHLENV